MHQGRPGISPWTEKRSWHFDQFPTFAARMDTILEALRTNKSVPHALIQVDSSKRFVAGPQREIRRKQDNMDRNEQRGELLERGRQVEEEEEDEDEEDEE